MIAEPSKQIAQKDAAKGLLQVPVEFERTLFQLDEDLCVALHFLASYGGVPKPVAESVLANLEPARCALDLALNRDRKATR